MIPETIKIGTHVFSIEQVATSELDDDCLGDIDIDKLTIRIRDNMPISLKHETIAHEMIHAIRKLSATELKDEGKEEDLVQITGLLLHQILQENDLSFIRVMPRL